MQQTDANIGTQTDGHTRRMNECFNISNGLGCYNGCSSWDVFTRRCLNASQSPLLLVAQWLNGDGPGCSKKMLWMMTK